MLVGRVNGSESEIVGNSNPIPPRIDIPRFTAAATSRRPALHGLSSLQLVAMPITGLRRTSSSVYPSPRKNARWSSPSGPMSVKSDPPPRATSFCDIANLSSYTCTDGVSLSEYYRYSSRMRPRERPRISGCRQCERGAAPTTVQPRPGAVVQSWACQVGLGVRAHNGANGQRNSSSAAHPL